MKRGISVIICCYNSSWIIRRTLESLMAQRFVSHIPYEIILVDNNCTDNTVSVAQDTMRVKMVDFRIIREEKPGLAYARRRGIQEAKYEYVVYCDDDNLLCLDYVSTVVSYFDKMPEVGAIGGRGIAEFEIEPAAIVKEHLECYAVGSQLEHKDWLWGAGLALRTELVKDVYNKQNCYLVGRKGNKLLSGDDSELVMSIVLRGFKTYPLDEISYIHVLKAARLSEDYFHRLYKGLTLPLPVLGVLQAVINDIGFRDAIGEYIYYTKRYIKYSVLWWKPLSKQKRGIALKEMESYKYWGTLRLYRMYRQWVAIKRKWTGTSITPKAHLLGRKNIR